MALLLYTAFAAETPRHTDYYYRQYLFTHFERATES